MVLKVAICGGGIGGLTTALCIDRLCGDKVEIECFEQAPQYKAFFIHRGGADERKSEQASDSDQMLRKSWNSSA
jgi:2-polyprenyl-6-methoxyphenol hydroxylase-like FAD-dependent oxidoreductase